MTSRRTSFFLVALALAMIASLSAGADETPECVATDHVIRTLGGPAADLSQAQPIMRFVNLSDTHILDDEASAAITGNALESGLEPTVGNGSAQRLQEEFTDEVLNAMIETINYCNEQEALDLMVVTGDLTDNSLLNETRRYIDNLDGVADQLTAFEDHCGYVTRDSNEAPKDETDGVCTAEMKIAPRVLTGRLMADSQAATPDPDDPSYQFTPTRSARQLIETYLASQTGGSHHVAPGLPPTLQCNEDTSGCANRALDIPHYAVFGNHDGYPRGTVTFQQPFQAGSVAYGRYFFESQRELINEFFYTQPTPGPVGHGFAHAGSRLNDSDDRNDGWYAFDGPGGAVRMIVLNTIADGVRSELHRDGATNAETGGHLNGNEVSDPRTLEAGHMSPAQFAWLDQELANNQGKPVLVFSHHPDRSFVERVAQGPLAAPHSGSVPADDLNELLGKYGNVVAHIAGHTHENRIRECKPGAGGCNINSSGSQPNVLNGFWRIETASLIDYPQEGRIVELFDLGGGSYALKLTAIRPDPNDPVAATSRELAIAEADCKVSMTLGGPLSRGPYDQSRLETFAENAQEAAVRSKFCYDGEGLAEGLGGPLDRNAILYP